MAVKRLQEEKNTSYFITFTCIKWLNIISESESYKAFYKWFEYLKTINIKVIAYVIMPNHFHAILYLPDNCAKNINLVVANGKRFLTYDIVKNLKESKKNNLLQILIENVSDYDKGKGVKHQVFQPSFDCKEMFNNEVLETKIDYIHKNPCKGKWNLANDYISYEFSSAAFYEIGKEDIYLTHYKSF